MAIERLDLSDYMQVHDFLRVRNEAFQFRSKDNKRIIYTPLTEDNLMQLLNEPDSFIYISCNQRNVTGGLRSEYTEENGIKMAKLTHACVAPNYQRRGIAQALLAYAEQEAAKAGIQLIYLNASHLVVSANRLYRKAGYKPLSINDHIPGTYYFIRYIKSLPPYRYPETKRIMSLLVSRLKFHLLFHGDSTPNFIHRLRYGRKQSKN